MEGVEILDIGSLMGQYGKAEPLEEVEPEVTGEPEISRELDNDTEEKS